jgi:Family of unknown function (DUF6502)
MSDSAQSILATSLARLLRPLVRVLLRNGTTYRAFTEMAKSAYVSVAAEDEFCIPRRKQSDSRIAVITGLTRKDVRRLRAPGSGRDADVGSAMASHNRAARVVEGWANDPTYRDADGPRCLSMEGPSSFAELVRRYSGDAPPRAVLDELERVGVAQRVGSSSVALIASRYDPIRNESEDLRRLGEGAGRVLEALDADLAGREGASSVRWVESTSAVTDEAADRYQARSQERNDQLLGTAAADLATVERAAQGPVIGTLVAQYRTQRED